MKLLFWYLFDLNLLLVWLELVPFQMLRSILFDVDHHDWADASWTSANVDGYLARYFIWLLKFFVCVSCCRFQISDLNIHQGMFTNDGVVICNKSARARNGSKSYGNNHPQKLIDRNRDG